MGKHLENCPSRKTVDTIVCEKVAISGAQVGEMLQGGKNTTLYSDETNKFGKTYNTFLITDESMNVYCLGLRDMCNKSSRTTLEIFKEILSDISEVCSEDTENIGNKILCNLKNFMSDRAKTNIAFTDMLVDYRKEIMPQISNSWDELDLEQRNACCRINNFFCGLHLLVNFAESSASVLKNFECMYKKVDSSESLKIFIL